MKRTLFLEFPMYVFDPAKHAEGALGARSAEEGQIGQQGDASQERQSGEPLTGT